MRAALLYPLSPTPVIALALAASLVVPFVADARKVQVDDPEQRAQFLAKGARLVADYGSYQLFDADTVDPQMLRGRKIELRDDYDIIQLNAAPLDTTRAEIKALRKPLAAFTDKRMHLVQFAGPVLPEWREKLLGTGVKIVSYIPQNAFLVRGDTQTLMQLQQLAASANYIQWEGAYADDYKIHPNVRKGDTDEFTIQLVADADSNTATLARIDALGITPITRRSEVLGYVNVTVRLLPQNLQTIAAQPDVISIQPYYEPRRTCERQNQIIAGNLSGNVPSGPGYLAWLTSKGFTQAQFDASGFAVDISDSGIDNGSTSPNNFGLYVDGLRPGTSRVVYARLEGSPHGGSTIQGCDGHGNLNAHIVAGFNDLPNGFPHTDTNGFHYGLGVCPFVRVGSSVIFDPDRFTNPDYEDLQSRAYRDGARVCNNSWNANTGGAYNTDAQRYDALVRDAQPSGSAVPNAGNQEMVICFVAGNAGSSAQTVGSPGTAKNVIVVGAGENVQEFGGSDGSGISDSGADSANDVISFSSRGPCTDGRVKPDICAPGTHVSGGVPQAASPGTNGTANSCYDGSGVSGGVGSIYYPPGQQWYTASSGTSHSTPAVAGGCALVRQYFINNFTNPASPAMTKAFLMNSAAYMTGTGANDTLPSNNQGMGRMNLGTAFDGVARVLRDQLNADRFTASGQTRTFFGVVADTSKPFRVTLAWTDAPGSTTGNAYNNDLDLTVTVGGNTYKGNVFSGANSVTGGAADPRNNVESVFLPAGIAGAFTITVTAANINSDGVPNNADALDQDLALVVYNASETPTPAIVAGGASIVSEGCATANGAIDPNETVTVNFAVKNIGTANASNVVATLQAMGGVTAPSGPQTYGLLHTNGTAVTMPFTFTASGACGGTITATLQLQDGIQNLGTITFGFPLGVIISTTTARTNATAIAVPATGTSGSSSPYPSTILVSGVSGIVTKVTVTLRNVSHTFPDDIDVLLVGPTGAKTLLMSDAGGGGDINNVTLTIDDDAASSLPDSSQIVSGTFKPTNYDTSTDAFTAPAPAGPYTASLAAFDGANPNGTWSLYVRDDAPPDSGSIGAGWVLNITTISNSCCSTPVNQPPVVTNAFITPSAPDTTQTLTASVFASDPDNDPVTFGYQWQQSLNGTNFVDLAGEANNILSASVTVAGDFYRVIVTPDDGQTNGVPFTTASVLVPTDSDSNGLNDDWEVANFGQLGVDPDADPDGDGFTNVQEFIAGTDPNDATSAFVITSIAEDGDDIVITFASVSGKTYEGQHSNEPLGPIWVAFTNVTATSDSTEVTDPGAASEPERYYRVQVVP